MLGENDDFLEFNTIFDHQKKLLQIRNLILDGQLEYAEDLVFIDDIEPQQSNYELARISTLLGNNDDAISYLEDFLSNSKDKDSAEYLIKSDFAFDTLKVENARFIRLFIAEEDDDDEDDDDEFDDFDDSDFDDISFFSDIAPDETESSDQDIIDVVEEINNNVGSISDIITETYTDDTTQSDEDTNKDIDTPSLLMKEKKQTKKLDSSKDKPSDSDENTY